MAEAIARTVFKDADPPMFIGSAGIAALDGSPPTKEAMAALGRLGIEHDGRSKALTADMVKKADLVLCMTSNHMDGVQWMLGEDQAEQSKVHLLDATGAAVPDPIGMGQAVYDEVAARFQELIPGRIESLLAASP